MNNDEKYDPPADFRECQWWVEELDKLTANGTADQKRAMAVVRHLLKSIASSAAIRTDTVEVLRNDVKYAMGFLYSHEPRNEPLKVWARFGNALDAKPDPSETQRAADMAASAQPRIPRTAHG